MLHAKFSNLIYGRIYKYFDGENPLQNIKTKGIKMKKAVISILGIQSPKYIDGTAHVKDYKHQASYYFEDSSEKPKDYYNTLPLLIEKFSKNYEIIPIYTEDAKLFNQEVLTYANLECSFNDDISLIKEREYFEIFTKIDDLMDLYDEIIIDLTHGFRHLPILAIIDLVIQNFNSTKKIDKILFAKEIVKHTSSDKGEYEIVDLKEYLDIANISFVLSSFENNYTIANHIKTKDKDFQDLINMFSRFSEHIMANSLLNLFKGKNSLVEKMNNAIEAIKITDKVKPILSKLENIQKHLTLYIELKNKKTYIQLFELAKIMNKKGYYLNAITLLDESIGWYCAEKICSFSKNFTNKYNQLVNQSSYAIVSNAKNIIKFTFNHRKYANELKIVDIDEIQKQIENIPEAKNFAKNLINAVDHSRNNLAHGNSDEPIKNINMLFEKLFGRFNTYCIEKDILQKQEPTIENLQKMFN